MQHVYSCVSQVCHWWCPPFSAGHAAFLFICLAGLSLLVSALFHWRCDIYIHLSPRSVTGGVRPFPLAMQHFYSFVSQVCHCWCPPFSAGHVTVPFICLPNSLLLGVLNALKNGRLGAGWSGRVPGRLVSHFLSFVSQFFFPKQFTVRGSQCFKEWSPWCWMVWSGSRPACLPLPFICLPVLFICLPGWVLVVGFPAGLSPTSFHLSPTSFQLSPSSFHLSPRLGACGRVPGWLVSHFLSFVSQFFSFVSQNTSFHLSPTSFHCLPGWVLVVGFPAGLSPTSFHLSPRLGACGRVPGWLVSHFLSFVSQARCLWSGSRPACLPLRLICLPLLFICLPGWVPGRSPASFRLGACGRVPGWLVSHVLLFVSHFFSFVSQAGCLFPARLSPTSLHLSPTFAPNSLLLGVPNSFLRCVTAGVCTGHVAFLIIHVSPRSVTAGVRPFSAGHAAFLFMCLPGLSLLVSVVFRRRCNISIHLFPSSVTAGVRPFPLAMQHVYSFVSRVCHWCCRPFPLAM